MSGIGNSAARPAPLVIEPENGSRPSVAASRVELVEGLLNYAELKRRLERIDCMMSERGSKLIRKQPCRRLPIRIRHKSVWLIGVTAIVRLTFCDVDLCRLFGTSRSGLQLVLVGITHMPELTAEGIVAGYCRESSWRVKRLWISFRPPHSGQSGKNFVIARKQDFPFGKWLHEFFSGKRRGRFLDGWDRASTSRDGKTRHTR